MSDSRANSEFADFTHARQPLARKITTRHVGAPRESRSREAGRGGGGGDCARRRHACSRSGIGARAGDRAGRSLRPADRERDRLRELEAGQPAERVGRQRRRRRRASRASPPTSASTRARRSTSRSTPTPTDYRLDIYRLGYYGGDGARKVATVQPSAALPQTQPACLTDAATGLVDCGNWAVSASWAVPADAVSGIYFARARARRRARRREPHRLHRPRRRRRLRPAVPDLGHDLAGLQPVRRQQPLRRAPRPAAPTRSATTGRSRPAARRPRTGSSTPSTRWSAGSSATATTSATSPASTPTAAAPRSSSTRPSSRSATTSTGPAGQRANVEAARDAGVNLAFFSGNEVFWKTRWENSIDGSGTAAPHARLLQGDARRTPRSTRCPTSGPAPGATRASAHPPTAAEPENALTGTIFTVNCGTARDRGARRPTARCASGATPTHRRRSAPGETATLAADTLGYEWDEDLDNGVAARGPGPPVVDHRQRRRACSRTTARPTARAPRPTSLTLYRAPSGALVFGAGTVQWSWGLDGNHDRGGSTPDPRMQQATVNLFADMGAQPATLQPGLVAATASTDTAAPTSHDRRRPRAGAEVAGGPADRDHRHRHRRGRRRGRRRRGLDRRRRPWHPADGRGELDLRLDAGRDRPARRSGPAPSTTAATSRRPAPGVTVDVVPRDLSRARSGPTRRHGAAARTTRARSSSASSSAPTSPASSPASASTRRAGNTGTHVGHLWTTRRHAARARPPSPARRASGWQEVDLRGAGRDRRRHDLRRLLPHAERATTRPPTATSPAGGVDSPPLHALADGVDGPNGVYSYGAGGRLPDQHLRVDQLLGRRRLRRRRRPGHDAADDHLGRSPRPAPPASATAANVTATFSEAIDAGDDQRRQRSSCATPSNALVAGDRHLRRGATRTATLDPDGALGQLHHLHGDGQGRRRRRHRRRRQRARRRLTPGRSRPRPRRHRRPTRAPAGRSWWSPTPPTRSAATTPRSCAPRA